MLGFYNFDWQLWRGPIKKAGGCNRKGGGSMMKTTIGCRGLESRLYVGKGEGGGGAYTVLALSYKYDI